MKGEVFVKKYITTVVIVLVLLCTLALSCSAVTLKTDYMYDGHNKSYAAPAAYVANDIITGDTVGTTSFDAPKDLYVHTDGNVYIVDTGNNRIVIIDSDYKLVRIITEVILEDGTASALSSPEGVFHGPDDLIYICDTGNRRVVAIDKDNKVVISMDGKDLVAVNEKLEFKPQKVAVDENLSIYVIDSNVYQGILHYNHDGNFVGFFAPNDVEVSAAVRLAAMWKEIFSDEQLDYMQKALPAPYNNIFLSSEDYLFTTATGVEVGDEIKCLNTIGKNILITPQSQNGQVAYGDVELQYDDQNKMVSSVFVDVYCDENGIISALDSTRGRIFQYDSDSNLVCIFGGLGTKLGMFQNPTAIEKNKDEYLILDAKNNSITTFVATEYILDVYEALSYYKKGLYEESVDLWKDVLKQNNKYTIAYRSIGRAYLQQGYYKEAMEVLKEGNDKYFYSMALKEYRKEYTRDNLWWMLIVGIGGIWAASFGLKKLFRWLNPNTVSTKKKKG